MARADNLYAPLLESLGGVDKRIVVVDAGLGTSMQTGAFKARYPERYVNLGIAEANAVSFASGLARRGLRPFVHSFSNFLARRAHDQIAMSVVAGALPITYVAGSCGVFDGRNGPSHFAGDDLAAVCALPGMTAYEPADAVDLDGALKAAVAYDGPTYIRLRRNGMPQSIGDCGRHTAPTRLIRLSDAVPEVTIVAIGTMLDEALIACKILLDHGVTAELAHVLRLKPLDPAEILASARRTRRVVAIENHVAHGGAATNVAAILAEAGISVDFASLTLPDEILPAGDQRWLLARCGLDATSIAERVIALQSTKGVPCSSISPH